MSEVIRGVVDGVDKEPNSRELLLCLYVAVAKQESMQVGEPVRAQTQLPFKN